MAFPLHSWRRWHRKVNLNQKRHALASSIAATVVLPLIQARGHKVSEVPQLPLVLGSEVNKIQKTKEAVALLERFGLHKDVERVQKGKVIRPGMSKVRGKKYRLKKGPLFVVDDEA